ncbi:hypothetical protein G3I76_33380 [Streptomyces sp. SID11233]|nr:hypothetical protein [Streptomyces sp. SID11233]
MGPVSKVELTRCSFEDIEEFHSIIQGHDESSRVTDVTMTDLTVNSELIEKASDALIDIKEHTSGITFATS